jgi:hypothetical protein
MNKIFYVVGEDIDGEIIEYEFEGILENCKIDAEKTLAFVGGGHLDIFVIHDDYDEFICDMEV